jgi:RNA ligase (TIGR02306 family)
MSSLIVETCRIANIEPHPNADRLEIATVKGWNVIIQKGQYQIGDMVVFIPPDSILPQSLIEEYQLDYLKNNGRVGTVKLRGFISQGLVLPSPNNREGVDVAKVLGITKYEVPEPTFYKSRKVVSKKKTNPLFDKYTDIENIKNFDTVFAEGEMVVVTEKLHGTNARFGNLPITISSGQPLLYKISAWLKKLFGQKYEFV